MDLPLLLIIISTLMYSKLSMLDVLLVGDYGGYEHVCESNLLFIHRGLTLPTCQLTLIIN